MRRLSKILCGFLLSSLAVGPTSAAEVKVLTAGAMKEVVLAIVPAFEKQTGHTVSLKNDTVGALVRRIGEGEAFDVAVLTPGAVKELTDKGKIVPGSGTSIAQVGVGVMVKAGASQPDIASVDAFKKALLAAGSVAYIDPASGGSSGIYVAGLLDKLGIAGEVKPKAKLKQGGHVADLVKTGEAEIGIHQISEIVPVKEVTLVGPLPKEIQNLTVYAVGLGTDAADAAAAKALMDVLKGPAAADILKSKGMEKPGT